MIIKVLLADDHSIVREGLRSLLEREPDIKVVGEASNGISVIKLVKELKPDIVIMDVSMPDLNGIEATRQIAEHDSSIKVLALSIHADKIYVLAMMKAGASGYLLKDCVSEELISAIKELPRNRTYLSPRINTELINDLIERSRKDDVSVYSLLTPREREITQLLAEGRNKREIAAKLFISVKTVDTHRMRVLNKLGLNSMAELTKYAIREGLTTL